MESASAAPTLELPAHSLQRAGIGRSRAYELIARGEFPKPVKLGRSSRFVSTEIDAWIAARIAERDAKGGAT